MLLHYFYIIMKKNYVYDLETLNIFTATFYHKESNDKRVFILTDTINQIKELLEFLDNDVKGLIGFNCLNFDSQILEYIYRNKNCTATDIQRYAAIITSEDSNDRRPDVPEWKLRIKHLDLYKIHHFDNKNKRTGLKWCEFMFNMENIEDLPSQGEGDNWVEKVLSYNFNDVLATQRLLEETFHMIELRHYFTQKYKINLYNASNSRIGSEILLKLYCNKTGQLEKDVRSKRTYRDKIKFSDIIFPYISFKSEVFNRFLNELRTKEVEKTKDSFDYKINYKDFTFVYGLGGIHGSVDNLLIESNDEYSIIDCDVSSLYPSIAVANKMYPAHLGPEFYEVYKNDIVDVRLAEKAKGKEGNKHIISGLKESANSSYGKSNDTFSWMYDPQYTLQTTINGQLMLTMLSEMLFEIEDLSIIQINTDGITVKIPTIRTSRYYEICKQWESLTKLQLEYNEYSKMIILDVNNYIAVYKDITKEPKCKGRCEFKDIPLYKDKSHNIIPIAFYEYFVNNIPIETTILNHKNIFDFCAGKKAKKSKESGNSRYELHNIIDNKLNIVKLSKTVRYYVSNKGQYLIKCYDNGNKEYVEAPIKTRFGVIDWRVTYFNKAVYYDDFKLYDINYRYYIMKTQNLIDLVEKKPTVQLDLFK